MLLAEQAEAQQIPAEEAADAQAVPARAAAAPRPAAGTRVARSRPEPPNGAGSIRSSIRGPGYFPLGKNWSNNKKHLGY